MLVERIRELDLWTVRRGEAALPRLDRVAIEEPLEIRLDRSALAVIMRTPGHDSELVAGLLHAEELVRTSSDLASIAHCTDDENTIEVHSAEGRRRSRAKAERSLLTTSSCGLCGKLTIESLHTSAPPFAAFPRLDPELVHALPGRLRGVQEIFEQTGGLHAAAIFDRTGALVVCREDVGRHNAVDKCVGHLLLRDQLPLEGATLVVSGRASYEIVQKALVARIPAVVAVSAPSSLAVELARASKMFLAGFVRGDSFNVYAGEPG